MLELLQSDPSVHYHKYYSTTTSPHNMHSMFATLNNNNNTHNAHNKRNKSEKKEKEDSNKAPKQEVLRWMGETFRLNNKKYCLPKQLVYQEYIQFCERNGWTPASPASCGRLVHQAFPEVSCTRRGGRGSSAYHYGNLSFIDLSKQPLLKGQRYTPQSWPEAASSLRFNSFLPSSSPRSIKTQKHHHHQGNESPTPSSPISQYQQNCEGHPHQSDIKRNINFDDTESLSPSAGSISSPTSPSSSSTSPMLDSDNNNNNNQNQQPDCEIGMRKEIDSLRLLFDQFFQDLLFFLLQGNEELAYEVVQRFWREELRYELRRRDIKEIIFYERLGISMLLEKLASNPTGMREDSLAEYLKIIARQIPYWIYTEAMAVLQYHARLVHNLFCTELSKEISKMAEELITKKSTETK